MTCHLPTQSHRTLIFRANFIHNSIFTPYRVSRGHDRQLTFHQMNQSSSHSDEDQDSLFGSPPLSPVRGRLPSQETFIREEQAGPVTAIPSMGVCRKNVGTIALPGSHMSCAELPADLPALSLPPPHLASSYDSSQTSSPNVAGLVHTPATISRSISRSVSSSAPSSVGPILSASATRKRRAPKAKSLTPASPAPPITLPGPNEPTPPNFLRSQSSLLGLAGLVGSVKPSRLYAHGPRPSSAQQYLPIRGSTPIHPIVLDDDQDSPYTEEQFCSKAQIPQCLDQLNPEILRSNIINSLAREKNTLPVLESLIKLLGADPHVTSTSPPPQPFSRPFGHGIFNVQSASPAAPMSVDGDPTIPTVPQKRRKLKHVPAGAVDWDVPFPFVSGEGPQGYRDTWAQDRAKQLITQLLELVQNATRRAAVKTAKNGRNRFVEQSRMQNRRSSRSAPVETQTRPTSTAQEDICGSALHASPKKMGAPRNVIPMAGLYRPLALLPSSSTIGSPSSDSKDRASVYLEGAAEEGGLADPCDCSVFEEWLSQLQQFVPLETDVLTPESDWGTLLSVPSTSLSALTPSVHASTQCNTVPTPNTRGEERIDPTPFAMSQLGDTQSLDFCSIPTPPSLTYSPRTSLSSLTEPLTPLSEAFADVSRNTIAHQELDRNHRINRLAEKDHLLLTNPATLLKPPCTAWTREEKASGGVSIASAIPSVSGRYMPGTVRTSKGALDKQVILESARERRRQLVTEIDRSKIELWETSIEHAVLVHLTRDGSLGSCTPT